MNKLFTTVLLLLVGLGLRAQLYNNEWIDFSKTYYKFKVGATGLYRIPQSVLAGSGLQNTPVQNFQLFRNGEEVPIYTSVSSGTLGSSDYIEFWGRMNDGVPDSPLYRSPSYQHTKHTSLETDTAVYFLTVNPTSSTFHYVNTTNDTTGTSLTVSPYFMYTAGTYFKAQVNPGLAEVIGEYIYSSSYDVGEWWSTNFIYAGAGNAFSSTINNLYVYTGGPNATLKFGLAGCDDDTRTYSVSLNGSTVSSTEMDSFNDLVTSVSVPVSAISSNSATVQYTNNSSTPTDRMVSSFYELNYPRQFNFGGAASFYFELPANTNGYFLKINNFNVSASATPVLYDMTSGLRYTAIYSSGSPLSFLLGGSSAMRRLVLVNEDPSIVTNVTSLTTKNFVNFANSANQSNYAIITNPQSNLYTGSSGNNPVFDFKNYRNSAAGGSWDAQVYDINELVDQFAFGIKKHPLSIQNFLRYARNTWSVKPQYCLLIGHGLMYTDYNGYSEQQHLAMADQLDLVPTFGNPASDNMLSSGNGATAVPVTPIGRLSVVYGTEIENYLAKVKEYESTQASAPNTIAGRLWMKNYLHLTGVSEPYLGAIICSYMGSYQAIVQDTLVGASVSTYCDGNAATISQVPTSAIANLFSTGFSVLNYFGHSSNTVLAYNLNTPADYNNPGKYPVFYVNGCDAGDFFVYDPQRFSTNLTISESYVLAKERGSIAFVASTNFGVVDYLNVLLYNQYQLMDHADYGKSIGVLEEDALQALVNSSPGDFLTRIHAEQMTTHGDPSLKLNEESLPDYDLEASEVVINPSFVAVSNSNFTVNATWYNLGKAVSDSITILVQRTYPDGSTATLLRKRVVGTRYADSIQLSVPIVATRDKGQNKITITINSDNNVQEVTLANNSITAGVYIYQNEATPVYPYNYAIINTSTSKLVASTANPLSATQQYIMEIDTTQNFNSPLMVTKYITMGGGEMEFDPGITYKDSVVYYWRVGIVPATSGGSYTWNNASFVYIDPSHSTVGFNQSHYFQHLGSATTNMSLTSNRLWTFGTQTHNFYLINSIDGYGGFYDQDFSTSVDGNLVSQSACVGYSIIFTVFSPVTFNAWANVNSAGNNLYLSGSGASNCATDRYNNIEFQILTPQQRYLAMRFMDSIPNGYFVTVRSVYYHVPEMYSATWEADTTLYGSGKSLYHYLKNAGFALIDSVNAPKYWQFVYKKNDNSFTPAYAVSADLNGKIYTSANAIGPTYSGTVTSPQMGPASKWGTVHWRGTDLTNPPTDTVGVQIYGVDTGGIATPLYNLTRSVQDFDISAINAKKYPYIQMKLSTTDTMHALPYQLKYWRANYTPAPEGALAPNLLLRSTDTVQLGQQMEFAIAFKNVSPYTFDSMKIQLYIIDKNNVTHQITEPRRRPIVSGDTLLLDYIIDTRNYPGANTLYVDFNPNYDQPEQYLFNNFLYKTFYVNSDSRNPLLDVTFDNVHILNNDLVSARPHIQVKLKSQSQYLLLSDTSLISVQVKYPDGTTHPYSFSSDTLRFTPATSGSNNTATVDFYPSFTTQYNANGDEYQLIVTGKDAVGNTAGTTAYRVGFTIINKSMISNVLNYPNPFSTSTAFVFTITGSEVPQNMKIQILTITGRVVREITKEELGPLHVGRNITEYKWNGTDMFGQRLANGVYLYHVVTNLNGKSMDKYTATGDNTSQYFNNGYGKMYLMK